MLTFPTCFLVEFIPNFVFKVDGEDKLSSLEPVSFVTNCEPTIKVIQDAMVVETDMESYNPHTNKKGSRTASFSQVDLMLKCLDLAPDYPLIPFDFEMVTKLDRDIYLAPSDPTSVRVGTVSISALPIHE